ncbi:MAG: thiamine pyrophosphate-dependent enzyme [Patescibacteria group bacterium]
MPEKEINNSPELTPGHRTCAGCPAPVIVRAVLESSDDPVVVAAATGCLEVTTTIYPQTSWNVPFIHSAFENAAATIAGVETAFQVLKKKKEKTKLEQGEGVFEKQFGFDLANKINFIVFGGDGGTYDIGLQSLSGALERGHNFLYVCYDNQGYMNTGGQRSSASPKGADTSTTPPGKFSTGKTQFRKNLMEIVAAHDIPYAAQASPHNLADLRSKAKKAFSIRGPKFINVLSPCPTVWKFPPGQSSEIAKLAVQTRFWPIYEIENHRLKLNWEPPEFTPVEEFLKTQKRFSHLFKTDQGKKEIQKIQQKIDLEWEKLKQ